MGGIVFIGDEVSAAGYRLAGAETMTPAPNEAAAAFATARQRADVVMITAQSARHLPLQTLERAQLAPRPLVIVVPDVRGRAAPPDVEDHVRTVLGLEA